MKSMNESAVALKELAKKFRTNKVPQGSTELDKTIQTALTDRNLPQEVDYKKIGFLITEIYLCLDKADWLGLADYLDHDLPKALHSIH